MTKNQETEVRFKNDTISPKTQVPIGMVAFILVFLLQLEAVGLLAWKDVQLEAQSIHRDIADLQKEHKRDVAEIHATYMTEQQMRDWLESARDYNVPPIKFPKLPPKNNNPVGMLDPLLNDGQSSVKIVSSD